MNNYNNNEPILNGVNKYPIINISIIVFTIIIILLYRYFMSNPQIFKVLFIILLVIGLIGFILKHFHINIKKAFFISLFIVISIIITVLILAQGDYIKLGKNIIIPENEEQYNEEENYYYNQEEDNDTTIVDYSNIECFDNYENFKSLKGPCFNKSTGFGYSYINGSDCNEEKKKVLSENDCSIYANALKNKYESLLQDQLNKIKDSEDISDKCKSVFQEVEEEKKFNCQPFNKNNKDKSCDNTTGGFKSVSFENCPSGHGVVQCDKNYSNGEYYSVNSTECEPISSDFDYLCKQSNTDMNDFQSIGAKKYLSCKLDPITKKPIKYEALCDYGYSKTKNLYYEYTPCYHSSDDQSKFDEYCQKNNNVNATQKFNYNCPINFKRAKCDLSS